MLLIFQIVLKQKNIMKYVLSLGLLINSHINYSLYAQDSSTQNNSNQFSNINQVVLTQYYNKPLSYFDKESIIIKGSDKGEFIEIKVEGIIRDFEYFTLKMEDSGNLIESELITKFKQISNQTLIIECSIPGGIPFEKIKWKNINFKEFEFIISENGLHHNRQKIFFLD